MKKRTFALLLAAIMGVTMLAACGGNSDDAADPAPADEGTTETADEGGEEAEDTGAEASGDGFKVASHNAVIEGNPYRVVYEDQMTQAVEDAKAAGYIGQYASFTANNDPAVESQQIEQTINEGYDIIMVNPIAATGLDSVIDKALEADIIYINADCEYESDKILNVVVDQTEWARIQGEFAIETLGEGSKVIAFKGLDGNSASEMRQAEWARQMEEANIEIVKQMTHGWSDPDAKQLMSEVISSGLEFDGIINEESAVGIMSAIEESNIDYPGCITSSEEVAWIRKIAEINADELVCPFIVVENPPGIGATALAIAINIGLGEEIDEANLTGLEGNSIYYKPQWIMTYDNMDERLESIADLPDSTSVSSYLSVEEAKAAYFK